MATEDEANQGPGPPGVAATDEQVLLAAEAPSVQAPLRRKSLSEAAAPERQHYSFTSVFELVNVPAQKSGDVTQLTDKTIGKKVFRIRGSVPAVNYLQIPSDECLKRAPSKHALGLAGKHIYLELKPFPGKVMTFHLDLATKEGDVLRLSFSTVFSELQVFDRTIKVPLRDIVDKGEGKWTFLCVSVPALLAKHPGGSKPTASLRSLRLCSNMLVRGVYVSDAAFSFDTLPKELSVPIFMGKTRSEGYNWVWVPESPPPGQAAAAALMTGPEAADRQTSEQQEGAGAQGDEVREERKRPGLGRLKKDGGRARHLARFKPRAKQEGGSSAARGVRGAGRAGPIRAEALSLKGQEPELPPEARALKMKRVINFTGGLRSNLAWSADDKQIIFSSNHVVVVMDAPPLPEPLHEDGSSAARGQQQQQSQNQDGKARLAQAGGQQLLSAGPSAGSTGPDLPPLTRQAFLSGHSDVITLLEVSPHGGLLATGQAGSVAEVRLWDVGARSCVCVLRAHQSDLVALAFSPDDSLLCTVGHDSRRRLQIKIWDVHRLVDHPPPPSQQQQPVEDLSDGSALLARQTSDFAVSRIKFSPFERRRLVSCGRENVRFWRVKRKHLPACPASLGEFSRQTEFTDLAFESSYGRLDDEEAPKVVFVATGQGTVVQVSYHTRELLCVLRLHNDAINCIAVNEGFVVTGSSDRFMRLWPLDFSDYVLEAQNESPVTAVSMSADGLQLLIGTSSGSIGVLDVVSHAYTTAMRSHTSRITALAADPSSLRDEFATAGVDGTIRIWDRASGCQRYEFMSPDDVAGCLAYHPYLHVIACGFVGGCVRIFDVPTTSTLQEYQQHRGAVTQLLYQRDGKRLFSAADCGSICVYDVLRDHQPVKMVSLEFPPPEHMAIDLSPDASLLAAACALPYTVVLLDAATLHTHRHLSKHHPPGGGQAATASPPVAALLDPPRFERLLLANSSSTAAVAVPWEEGPPPPGSVVREVHFLRGGTQLLAVALDRCLLFNLTASSPQEPAAAAGASPKTRQPQQQAALVVRLGAGPLRRLLLVHEDRLGFAIGQQQQHQQSPQLQQRHQRSSEQAKARAEPVIVVWSLQTTDGSKATRGEGDSSSPSRLLLPASEQQQQLSPSSPGVAVRAKGDEAAASPFRVLETYPAHLGEVQDMVLSSDGSHLLTADDRGGIIVWELNAALRSNNRRGREGPLARPLDLLKAANQDTAGKDLAGGEGRLLICGAGQVGDGQLEQGEEAGGEGVEMMTALDRAPPLKQYVLRREWGGDATSSSSTDRARAGAGWAVAGLTPRMVYGYNGHVSDSLAWVQAEGVVVHGLGPHLVLTDLEAGHASSPSSLQAHRGEVSGLAYAPATGLLASACGPLTASQEAVSGDWVKLWWLDDDDRQLRQLSAVPGPVEGVQSLAFSPQGTRLVVLSLERAGSSAITVFHDVPSPTATSASRRCPGPLYDAAFVGEELLATAGRKLCLWSVSADGRELRPCGGPLVEPEDGGYVTALAWGRRSRRLQRGRGDGAEGQEEEDVLLAGGTEGCLWLMTRRGGGGGKGELHVETSWKLQVAAGSSSSSSSGGGEPGAEDVMALAVRGSRAIMGCTHGIFVWDLSRGEEEAPSLLCAIKLEAGVLPRAMQWDEALEDGLVGTSDGTIWYLQLDLTSAASPAVPSQIKLTSSPVGPAPRLAVSPCTPAEAGGLLMATTAGANAGLQLWSLRHRSPVYVHEGAAFESTCLAFFEAGRSLACGCSDGVLRFIDMDRGSEQLVLHTGPQPQGPRREIRQLVVIGDNRVSKQQQQQQQQQQEAWGERGGASFFSFLSLDGDGHVVAHRLARQGGVLRSSEERLMTLPGAWSLDVAALGAASPSSPVRVLVQSSSEMVLLEMDPQTLLTGRPPPAAQGAVTGRRRMRLDGGGLGDGIISEPSGGGGPGPGEGGCQYGVSASLMAFSLARPEAVVWARNGDEGATVGWWSVSEGKLSKDCVTPLRLEEPVSCMRLAVLQGGSLHVVALGTVCGQVLVLGEDGTVLAKVARAHSSCITDLQFSDEQSCRAGSQDTVDRGAILVSISYSEMFVWSLEALTGCS